MVAAYLENIKDVYVQQKEISEKKLNSLKVKLKENEKIMKILEENSDISYESFTPRKVNSKNKEKMEEEKEKQKQIKAELQHTEKQLYQWKRRLAEINDIILQEKQKEKQIVQLQEKLDKISLDKLTDLSNRTLLCSRLMEIDPFRCKIEMNTIIEKVNSIICDLQETQNTSRERETES